MTATITDCIAPARPLTVESLRASIRASIRHAQRELLINRLDHVELTISRLPPGGERDALSARREQLVDAIGAHLLDQSITRPSNQGDA